MFSPSDYSASSKFPKNPLKIPFSEFEPLYWKELQRRQQKLRTVRKQLVSPDNMCHFIIHAQSKATLIKKKTFVSCGAGG